LGEPSRTHLADEGALVGVHHGSKHEAAKETLAIIDAAGGRAFLIRAPLGEDGDLDVLFAALNDGLAGAPLDVLRKMCRGTFSWTTTLGTQPNASKVCT
jgi:3-oxoacyl-[acyl-carrier protein] reductase